MGRLVRLTSGCRTKDVRGLTDAGLPRALRAAVVRHHTDGALKAIAALEGRSAAAVSSGAVWTDDFLREQLAPTSPAWSDRQLQAYLFDTLLLRSETGFGEHSRQRVPSRNSLALDLGYHSYFDAFCAIRGLAPDRLEDLAVRLLERTEDDYFRRWEAISTSPMSEKAFEHAVAAALAREPDRYSFGFVVQYLQDTVRSLDLERVIRLIAPAPLGRSANVSVAEPRSATVFIEEARGLESFRGACHALGHAFFAVHPSVGVEDLLGSNIAASEVAAFAAQDIALGNEPDGYERSVVELLPLYYARLYAVRLQHERRLYRGEQVDISYRAACERALRLTTTHAFEPRMRLVSIDFTVAYAGYLDLAHPIQSWQQVAGAITTNAELVRRHSCEAMDVQFGR